MTEEDIERAQALVEEMVQAIKHLDKTTKALKKLVMEYQRQILKHISGGKP